MILYGSSDSGHSYKVKLFLSLADITHSYRWVDLSLPRDDRGADFNAASQFGEVPVLIDGAQNLCQSNAILLYLADKYALFNGNDADKADIAKWLFWESNRIGFSLPNLRFATGWQPQPASVMHYLTDRTLSDLDTLEQFLSERDFLLLCGPTIADISCCAYLFWLHDVGISVTEYPYIARWLDRIKSLPGWLSLEQCLQLG